MMRTQETQIIALACLLLSMATPPAYAYPRGSPVKSCGSMFPHHGASSQTKMSPYTISSSASKYTKDENITVTVTTNEPTEFFFEGLCIQARRADCKDGEPIGRFYLSNADAEVKVQSCPGKYDGNAITHTTNSHKTSKTFIWTNPDGMHDVFFQATVVNHKNIFWSNLHSKVVYDADSGNTSVIYNPCPGQTVMVPHHHDHTTTTAPSSGAPFGVRSATSGGVLLGLIGVLVARYQ